MAVVEIYVLDTDVVSNLAKARPCEQLLRWYAQLLPTQIRISTSTIFEIQRGIEMARAEHPDRAAEKEAWLNGLINSGVHFVSQDVTAARLRAKMSAIAELKHFLIMDARSAKLKFGEDLAIAATAISIGAVVASFNIKDFIAIHMHFPLPGIYHPGQGTWVVRGAAGSWRPPAMGQLR